MLAQILFLIILIAAIVFFTYNVRKIIRNINLGLPTNRSDRPAERWLIMLKVAFGQTKMMARPIPAIMHFLIYAGFIIINIEVLEIIIDGLSGSHRIFAHPLRQFYNFLIAAFEWLAIAVLAACIVFLARRNILKLKRFYAREITNWPRSDANIILITEILLMAAFLTMNAADYKLQQSAYYIKAGTFPVSAFMSIFLPDNPNTLILMERFCWWFHIIGILAFLNYLPYSKHFHILIAFPNTYYSKLQPKAEFNNMPSVTNEVKAMLDPSFIPEPATFQKFGAKDVTDLTWKNLMEAYTCTECGRCTSECPANITGKLLSPRKIMMDTRDRLNEVGKNIDKHGKEFSDGKSLLDDYILREEIWACTSCMACLKACPVNIDPLSIIIELRRYIIMEESKGPGSLNNMFGNIENNGAPWKYSPMERFNWANNA
ncbi:4Fe-4S dicluster domain-containing protein [Rubrolithibacter danxiaensis]|uniref:4Fe-4S dicluster domain-containing protein n=1 Tax=Rubrolithibacter danxiaensis TaxID=3390805 RepID=UPI003BF8DAE4